MKKPKPEDKAFGRNLDKWSKQRGINLAELGRRLGYKSWRTMLYLVRDGKRTMSYEKKRALAAEFGLPERFVFSQKEYSDEEIEAIFGFAEIIEKAPNSQEFKTIADLISTYKERV